MRRNRASAFVIGGPIAHVFTRTVRGRDSPDGPSPCHSARASGRKEWHGRGCKERTRNRGG